MSLYLKEKKNAIYGVFFIFYRSMPKLSTLTAQVCMWAWSCDECTALNGRHGKQDQPGSPGMKAGRLLGEVENLCTLRVSGGETKESRG